MLVIYGGNGYTGELVARLAASSTLPVVLAGRSAAPLGTLAAELGRPYRVFGLDEPRAVDAGLAGAAAVLN